MKPCGPGAPTLASSSWEAKLLAGDGGKKARSPGRARTNRKTIAQGKPGCLRWTCMLVCVFLLHFSTRDRGCSAHPAFPAPSARQEGEFPQSSGAARREIAQLRLHGCLKIKSE